ncbi:MAG: hypothetical protein ACYCS8_12545 [Acidithiobacillus sp.]
MKHTAPKLLTRIGKVEAGKPLPDSTGQRDAGKIMEGPSILG